MEKPYIRPFVEKREDEVFSVGMVFSSPELAAGETISADDAWVEPAVTGELTVDLVAHTDTEVAVKISGGTPGKEYQLYVQAVTSAGQTLIGDILVRIIY
jgi:hypothetical protein